MDTKINLRTLLEIVIGSLVFLSPLALYLFSDILRERYGTFLLLGFVLLFLVVFLRWAKIGIRASQKEDKELKEFAESYSREKGIPLSEVYDERPIPRLLIIAFLLCVFVGLMILMIQLVAPEVGEKIYAFYIFAGVIAAFCFIALFYMVKLIIEESKTDRPFLYSPPDYSKHETEDVTLKESWKDSHVYQKIMLFSALFVAALVIIIALIFLLSKI